jgi:hypothetical protein
MAATALTGFTLRLGQGTLIKLFSQLIPALIIGINIELPT